MKAPAAPVSDPDGAAAAAALADDAGAGPVLRDPFGREIRYLRLSVTDRCDLRCSYCLLPDVRFVPRAELLSLEELDILASGFVELGVRKLRITGGEPLVRRGIEGLFGALSRHVVSGALQELTLTTNATQLARHAAMLADNGVRRINVSLDTLDPARFAAITGADVLPAVLAGIAAARAAGIAVKLNVVALRGLNEGDLFPLVEYCAAEGMDLTFIEVMPMGDMPPAARLDRFWPLGDLRARLAGRYTVTEDEHHRTGGPARYVRLRETGQRIGFITPLTGNFCEGCNRVRVDCRGQLHLCLGREEQADLRGALRTGGPEGLRSAIRAAIARKPAAHGFDYSDGKVAGTMPRPMSHTGG
ncbi:GTP 3',8-cyclase MoaA [Phaeovulum vinaykumarii]|uniref:GTP 3',8-cyclase n=1 Tax=Phaeovulum vinaykumarii TaxID=407234 RepID=A0A1N7JX37_9RHOB|nr:GTP 3',8-cyclase MoaA [Phaeovulum vinaykumarii]SIS53919.1 cyclic pyranopterin phosphate synthase [Phaeovulum vinaykumarii]SOB91755.1 cyclic pyranopterin phosphate synthase [Phaeovulum vinaykumarii]